MDKKYISCYETNASRLAGKAERVVFPRSVEEVQKLIKTSEQDIVPRGAGTGLVGGCVPNDSLVVSMEKMNKIINFDRAHRLVYVEAGISIKELNEKLNAIGFEFFVQPLNPASTIGGMVAVNTFDSRSMKYGKIKDWIEGIEFVNGAGELMNISKTDLSDVCGMEGITGIIVKVKLKISPKIKRSISIFQTDNLSEALSISKRLKQEKDVVMTDLFSKEVFKLLGLVEKYHLIIEFDSDRGKIKGNEYKDIVKLKNRAYYALIKEGYYNVEDYKFFFDKLEEFILYLDASDVPYFSSLGIGVIYSFFKDKEISKRKNVIEFVKKKGGKLGGKGIGVKRKDFLDNFEKKIIQRIKSRYDVFGKLNNGKIIDFQAKVDKSDYESEIGVKTPEVNMNEFIQEVELTEGNNNLSFLEKKKCLIEKESRIEKENIDRKQNIKDIVKKKLEKNNSIEKRGKLSEEEKDIVNRVMMGSFGLSSNDKEGKNEKE